MLINRHIVVGPNEFEKSHPNLIDEVLKKFCFDRSKEKMNKTKLARVSLSNEFVRYCS